MMMACLSSSDTRTQVEKDDFSMLITRSFERTSSFFTWSPVTLVVPAMPKLEGRKQQKISQGHQNFAGGKHEGIWKKESRQARVALPGEAGKGGCGDTAWKAQFQS